MVERTLLVLAAGAAVSVSLPVEAADVRNIVLIAGTKSHGPEGNRIHDYPWSVRLLRTMLEHSNIRDQVAVTTHFNGWPADPATLENADTIMIISDGRDGARYSEAPHLATPARVRWIDQLAKRGCGIITFHFSTFAPDALADQVLDWYGGFFDWETDGRREWYSNITTLDAEVTPASPGHPVLNGIEPFTLREEFYFDIRFRPDDPRWRPIWTVDALPAGKPNGSVVAWAVEREDGGRGFATTCGHFYDNWEHEPFRKTILNAIAWTAKIAVPDGGVQSPFFEREAIAAHLNQPGLIASGVETADDTRYADQPYWYKPGHPANPAKATSIQTLPGFTAERILTVPESFGSWTALAVDTKGRLLAAAQHQPGIYRVTPPPLTDPAAETRVEKLGGAAETMGWSHGLLYAFDSLYVTVAEANDSAPTGIHRLRDTDGDDQFDDSRLLFELRASGEHGPHNMVVGPGGESLYLMCGNGTPLPEDVHLHRPVGTEGIDHLMPPGFESSKHTVAGWVMRFAPDGGNRELIASGLRNSYDLAFNRDGDLFTFDSDMEWDLGTPWYRPTRICHVVSGAEFGWRADAAKWPEHYEDSVPPVVNIGPASPTGITFGYGAKFPEKYQRALYACDWTFATIHAVHLEPDGAGYRANVEEFLGGTGLPVTDAIIAPDGAMYFAVGGRRLGSAVYRLQYTGDENTRAVPANPSDQNPSGELPSLRRTLESLHGRVDALAVETAWPHLGHADRAIRFAARIAVETQPVLQWRDRALAESDPDILLTALLALTRQGSATDQSRVLERLIHLPWEQLPPERQLRALRVAEHALARGGEAIEARRRSVRTALRPLFPRADRLVNRELSRLLCYLGDTSIIDPLLDLMDSDTGGRPPLGSGYFVRNPKYGTAVRDMIESAPRLERMHHAQMLLWLDDGWSVDQRRRYFELIADAVRHSKGGHQYREFWNRIRNIALEQIPTEQRGQYESISFETAPALAEALPAPSGPGRDWSLEAALELVRRGLEGRDLANGRTMYSASGCVVCHRFNGEGGAIGPDLSSIGQRFTVRDILDATLHPSRAISDQHQVTTLELDNGSTLSGRIVSRDTKTTRIAPNLMKPTESIAVENASIRLERREPVSTMPSGLLTPLNEDELLDLLAYLVSGGEQNGSPTQP